MTKPSLSRTAVSVAVSLRSFCRSTSGTTMPLFGLMFTASIFSAGMAVDYLRAFSVQTSLQSATDSAAVAIGRGASAGNGELNAALVRMGEAYITEGTERVPAGTEVRNEIAMKRGAISVTASAVVPTTFTAIFQFKSIKVDAVSSSTIAGAAKPLCILGLNAAAPDTVKIWGSADLIAPNCAVQSNSQHAVGLDSGGSGRANAAFFCAAAASYGGNGFSPKPTTHCPVIVDPYRNKYTPAALSNVGVDVYRGCDQTKHYKINGSVTFSASSPTTPYVFCGGITVNAGARVAFRPGIYVIYGQFLVSSTAIVDAPGVTFYFADAGLGTGLKDGYLTIQGGGNINLSAPTSGPTAGMAILQPLVSTYTGASSPAITNTIIGTGALNITGVIYTPQAQILVTGDGELNTGTSYFGMVADFVTLQGNGTLNVGANGDAAAVGMPLMPYIANPGIMASLTH